MAKERKGYNCTQLTPQKEFERHIYHRDQFAHYLRWSHVLKNAKIGQKILDFGCGSGEMLELFYRNKYRPAKYVGLDFRQNQINENIEKFGKLDFVTFKQQDLCQEFDLGETFDIITCFEVIEHIGHKNVDAFLDNLAFHCNENTVVYLSTPNYDPHVGAAQNHMLGPNHDEVGEWDYNELNAKLEEYFVIDKAYGTFASQRDYKEDLHDWQIPMYEALKEYYDSNLVSNIMAPLVPAEHARNCIRVMHVRPEE